MYIGIFHPREIKDTRFDGVVCYEVPNDLVSVLTFAHVGVPRMFIFIFSCECGLLA